MSNVHLSSTPGGDAPRNQRVFRLRWLWITTGGPIWLCIGGRKPLAHLPAAHWRRHMPVIRWRLR